jgi:hypothetical protein
MMKSSRLSFLYIALINIIILPVKSGFAMDPIVPLRLLPERGLQQQQGSQREPISGHPRQEQNLKLKIQKETNNAKMAADEARIAEKEFKIDQKRLKKLKDQGKYKKVSEAVAPFSKPLAIHILKKSIHASGTYPAAVRKAVDSGDNAYDKHKKASEHEENAAQLFKTRAAQYPPDHIKNISSTVEAIHYEKEGRRHLEKAIKINHQTLKLSEERRALHEKLGSPPEYLPPTIPEKNLNDSPPAYKP